MDQPRSLGDIFANAPIPRNSTNPGSEEVTENQAEPDAQLADKGFHDPTGTDLASQIAASATGSAVTKPKKKRPKKPPAPARNRRSDPVQLGDAVNALIAQRGWGSQINLKALLADWAALVGETNADHSHPEAYVDNVLTIRADSTAWATSLRLFAPQLVAKINAELGDGTVVRVEVLGPVAPSWKHGLRTVRDGRGPRDTYG
ncbi:MAG: hypothetical protein CR979_01815 [Propionibacterium sp.]|nr:MAG: hypothetical protein CR979_01815 [Propionibacterium sp.]